MRKLIPVVLAVLGLAAGVGGGLAMRPEAAPPEEGAEHSGDAKSAGAEASPKSRATHGEKAGGKDKGKSDEPGYDYVNLKNQFVVPVLRQTRVDALVVLSLDLEVTAGMSEEVYRIEPRLRDNFLGVLFDHANAGGFDGAFTTSGAMAILRTALLEAGRKSLGDGLHDVLITDIMRQDT